MPNHAMDRGAIRAALDGFVKHWSEQVYRWKLRKTGHVEKSYAQQFWSDLLRCFGVIPERIDLFEKDAQRASTGNTGYIDIFWSSVVIGEAKSPGKDLDEAHQQTLDYLAGGSIGEHEWPRYAIVTDFEHFRVDRFGDEPWTVRFSLEQLHDHVDQLIFLAGIETVTKREEEEASIVASRVMADLYTAMVGDDADLGVGEEAPEDPEDEDDLTEQASVFLTRLLFLLYGDDAGLWEADLFYRFVLYDTTPDNLGSQLNGLFGVLNQQEGRRRRVPASMAKFPYVNGSLFRDPAPTAFFSAEMREALLAACRFRWTQISPAVFGSMFQMVKSKEARGSFGEHYTTEANIAKTIGPLFLDDLRREADRLTRSKSIPWRKLRAFQQQLAEHAFLDPACGSGNFLNLAYARLRDIETDLIVAIHERRKNTMNVSFDATLDTVVTIDQFHGFEINWWPAKIAETAMFLVDHQANRKLAQAIGIAPDRLPITITAHIHHIDALEIDWRDSIPPTKGATYVFGNPPFLGHESRSEFQTAQLKRLWGAKSIGRLDYVTGWHVKTLELLANRAGEFAYVSTNSITQGDQVHRLFGPILGEGWRIKFAHDTFAWTSEVPGAAAVHCVIVGFTRDPVATQRLWVYTDPKGEPSPVALTIGLNPYLVDGPEVVVPPRRQPLGTSLAPAVFGNMPRDDGFLLVEPDEYEQVMADPVAARYVRRFVGAQQLIHNEDRWCLWLVDLDPADVKASPELKRRLARVRDFRMRSSAGSTRQMAATPHLFGQRSQPVTRYLCIPRHVSEDRRYLTVGYFDPEVIVGDSAFETPDPDGLLFGVISSSMFIAWLRTVGGALESRLRFANTLVWNTFPLPKLAEAPRRRIIEAGQKILETRALHAERSLAEHYNPLSPDPGLLRAHDALDREVDTAFGATKRASSDRQRLELLFATYAELTKGDVLPGVG